MHARPVAVGLGVTDRLRRALAELEITNRALSEARASLASDWQPVGSELTDEQADARTTARNAIAAAKRDLDE